MSAPDQRPILSFNVGGIGAKDELVLKSIMRLLHDRTKQLWFYTAGPADLYIAGEGTVAHAEAMRVASNSHVIKVLALSNDGRRRPGVLCLPIFAGELELEINLVGDVLQLLKRVHSAQAPSESLAQHAAAPTQSSTSSQNNSLLNAESVYKLKSWPPPGILSTPSRLRIATLISVKALSALDVHKKVGQPRDLCAAFLDELVSHGLATNMLPPAKAPLSSVEAGTAANKSPQNPHNQLGLLARIRSRLGLAGGAKA